MYDLLNAQLNLAQLNSTLNVVKSFAPQSTSEKAVKFKVKSEGQTPSSIFQEINTFKFNFHSLKMNFYTTMYFYTLDMFFYSFKEHLLLTFIDPGAYVKWIYDYTFDKSISEC